MKKLLSIVLCLHILLLINLRADPIDSLQVIQIQKELAKRLETQMNQNEINDKEGKSHLNNYVIDLKAQVNNNQLTYITIDGGATIWNLDKPLINTEINKLNQRFAPKNLKYYLVIASIYKYDPTIGSVVPYTDEQLKRGIGQSSWTNRAVGYHEYKTQNSQDNNIPQIVQDRYKSSFDNFSKNFEPQNAGNNAIIDYVISFYIPYKQSHLVYHHGKIAFPDNINPYKKNFIYGQVNANYQNLLNNSTSDNKNNWVKENIKAVERGFFDSDLVIVNIENELKQKLGGSSDDCLERAVSRALKSPISIIPIPTEPQIVMQVYIGAIEFGICMTEEDKLNPNDAYVKAFLYGFLNELFETLDIEATAKDIAILVKSILDKQKNCNPILGTAGLNINDFNQMLACMGFNIQDIDQLRDLIEETLNYVKRNYKNPYYQGKATCFILTTFIPVLGEVKVLKATKTASQLAKIGRNSQLRNLARLFEKLKFRKIPQAKRLLKSRISLEKQDVILAVVERNNIRISEEVLEEVIDISGEIVQEYLDSKNEEELENIFKNLPSDKNQAIEYLKGFNKKIFEAASVQLDADKITKLGEIVVRNSDQFLDIVVHADKNNNYFVYLENAIGELKPIALSTYDIVDIIQKASYANGKMIRLLSCSDLGSAKAISTLMPDRIFIATEDLVRLHIDGGITTIARSGNATQKWRQLKNGEDKENVPDDWIRKPVGNAINNWVQMGEHLLNSDIEPYIKNIIINWDSNKKKVFYESTSFLEKINLINGTNLYTKYEEITFEVLNWERETFFSNNYENWVKLVLKQYDLSKFRAWRFVRSMQENPQFINISLGSFDGVGNFVSRKGYAYELQSTSFRDCHIRGFLEKGDWLTYEKVDHWMPHVAKAIKKSYDHSGQIYIHFDGNVTGFAGIYTNTDPFYFEGLASELRYLIDNGLVDKGRVKFFLGADPLPLNLKILLDDAIRERKIRVANNTNPNDNVNKTQKGNYGYNYE